MGRRAFNSPECSLGLKMLATGKSPVNLTITERKSLHILQILSERAPHIKDLSDSVSSGDQYEVTPLLKKALEMFLFLLIKQSNCEKARQLVEGTIENGISEDQ